MSRTDPTAAGPPSPARVPAGVVVSVRDLVIDFVDPHDRRAPHRRVVDEVGFDVAAGQVLALVGESGSGKTLTAKAIAGLLPTGAVAAGSVRLTADPVAAPVADEPDRLQADDRARLRAAGRSGMVFQEPHTALNPVRTVGWQLGEAIRARRSGSSRAALRARASELLGLVGLDDARYARAYPHQLSGGQKQRVVIAIALAGEPSLLIADEPTTALDVTVQAEILTLLADLGDRLGTAVLLITHNMGVVAELADHVLVMRSGRIVEQGEVAAVFAGPTRPYTRELLAAVPRLVGGSATEPDPGVTAPPAPDPIAPDPTVPDPIAPAPAVRVSGVDVVYPGRLGRAAHHAVSGVDLEIAVGEVVGLVGESGSGKTTLARAITGRLALGAGRIEVAGADLAGLSRRELRAARRRIGVVPQDPATTLDPLLSVGQSIAEPLLVHRIGTRAEVRERVAGLLRDVSLEPELAERLPHELSGGQRQRVAIARALALEPALVIADEPTSALDVTVQASVLELLAGLQSRLGFGCLFISHDLAVVQQVSDRVVVLRDGRVVESGPTAEVFGRPQADYTRALLAAVPVPDPEVRRRAA